MEQARSAIRSQQQEVKKKRDMTGRTVERDRSKDQRDDHPRSGEDHDLPPSNLVDVLESDQGKEEVDRGDDETGRGRVVEADGLENRRRVVPDHAKDGYVSLRGRGRGRVEGTKGDAYMRVLNPQSCWKACRPQPMIKARLFVPTVNVLFNRHQNVVLSVISRLVATLASSTASLALTCSSVA
jgi:hypothetical protein